MNTVFLVGRIKDVKDGVLSLNVSRHEATEDRPNRIIKITLTNHIRESVESYCRKGNVIGVKGYVDDNNIIVAEKITFLSSKSEK